MMVHQLKVVPEQFRALIGGTKRFEFRKDDRGFELGDLLELDEWNPAIKKYTGFSVWFAVSHIVRGPEFGIPVDHVVMSLVDPPQGLRTRTGAT